jgi:NADPH-dependent 2,4-dienoyl-CoA reductase/sulfur reductase-like enzyme
MGRALLADPDLPRKDAEGRDDDIIPCIGCNQGCFGRLMIQRTTATCMINPTAGREREFPPIPAAREKRMLVIGGGFVGCEVAEYAAERGTADITVLEMLKDVALDMVPFWNRIFFLERLADYKVKIVTSAEAKVILDDNGLGGHRGGHESRPANMIFQLLLRAVNASFPCRAYVPWISQG